MIKVLHESHNSRIIVNRHIIEQRRNMSFKQRIQKIIESELRYLLGVDNLKKLRKWTYFWDNTRIKSVDRPVIAPPSTF